VTLTRDLIYRLPKAELHVHLDGCLRPETMIDLARQQGVRLTANDPAALAETMHTRAKSLEEYLDRFKLTVAVMQTPAALERVAYEFVVDSARENVRYVEVRYCPALHTPALTLTQAVEAPLAGIQRAERETATRVGLIVCALRTLPPRVSQDLARLAVDYRGDGVVAFDLAGAERGHAAREHAAAFRYAAGHGLACTCHAGEGDGADSIRQALEDCGARRIGHGTRLLEDPRLEAEVCGRRIPLEMCLSSNVHTGVVPRLEDHPIRRYMDRGCVVTVNTDGRLTDGVSLTDEYWHLHQALGFSRAELERVILNGFESAFLPEVEKNAMLERVRRELQEVA